MTSPYEFEKSKVLKKAPQHSEEHVRPSPARRMNVRLAAQILSHRTAAAMRSCKEDLSTSASTTADLLDLFNSVFDFLNSNNVREVGSRRPALQQLWSAQQEVRNCGWIFLFLSL